MAIKWFVEVPKTTPEVKLVKAPELTVVERDDAEADLANRRLIGLTKQVPVTAVPQFVAFAGHELKAYRAWYKQWVPAADLEEILPPEVVSKLAAIIEHYGLGRVSFLVHKKTGEMMIVAATIGTDDSTVGEYGRIAQWNPRGDELTPSTIVMRHYRRRLYLTIGGAAVITVALIVLIPYTAAKHNSSINLGVVLPFFVLAMAMFQMRRRNRS